MVVPSCFQPIRNSCSARAAAGLPKIIIWRTGDYKYFCAWRRMLQKLCPQLWKLLWNSVRYKALKSVSDWFSGSTVPEIWGIFLPLFDFLLILTGHFQKDSLLSLFWDAVSLTQITNSQRLTFCREEFCDFLGNKSWYLTKQINI